MYSTTLLLSLSVYPVPVAITEMLYVPFAVITVVRSSVVAVTVVNKVLPL